MAEPFTLYRLKVTLDGIDPPIWRVLETPDCHLYCLHHLLQAAMGWEDDHLWGFETARGRFGPHRDAFTQTQPADKITLAGLVQAGQERFGYLYDFGDSWDHVVEMEALTVEDADRLRQPRCVGGARACPPENCGGSWGYQELLDILADPNHPEHAERLEWVGGELDAEKFGLAAVNAALERIWRRRSEMVLGEDGGAEGAEGDFDGPAILMFPAPATAPTPRDKEKKKKRKTAAQAKKRSRRK